jgi:hypothetical protein
LLRENDMVIARCAWHAFFRGYPRPLRVISWRGRGIAFSDTICRPCAQRVRIEGLWGSAPPTPVWPGSAQTALLFVGLPLLTALVLLATPLHDPGPPPPREEAIAASPATNLPAAEPRVAPGGAAPAPPAVARRQRIDGGGAPSVIYEVRRTRHGSRENVPAVVSTPAPATIAVPPTGVRRRAAPPAPERIMLAAATPSVERRVAAALLAQQSP